MKFKNLNIEARQILNDKCAKSCETWAKNPVLHPTVDTYYEAFTKGAKAALSLPVMSFSEAAAITHELTIFGKEDEHTERAWKAICHGDATTVEDALKLTEKSDPPSDPDPDEQTPPAASQEAADPDKEDAQ